MKKLMLAMLFLPAVSFADNVNFVSLNHVTLDDGFESVNAYSVGYQGVFGGKIAVGLSHLESQDDVCDDCDIQSLSANYAFGSFDEGSVYLGAVLVEDEGSTEGFTIGFAKISGDGLDYNFSAAVVEGVTAMGVSLRAPIGDSGLGWQVGLAESDGITTTMAGLSMAF
tara:strand:+ start:75 stop:578 length:504 start_codon:yes stop_codon:yes gene_type:complete